MLRTPSYLYTLFVLFSLLLLVESSIAWATELKPEHLPSIRDSSLKAELVFQGNFSREPEELSPVTSMTFLGHDILILSKNAGSVHSIINGTLLNASLLNVNVVTERESGLLGISVSEAKESNKKYVFLYYTESEKTNDNDICHTSNYCERASPVGNKLYRYEFNENKLVDPKLLLSLPDSPVSTHNGGKILIGPDNNIYLSVGDLMGSLNESSRTKAQNLRTEPDGRAGILRLTQDGKPVSENILGDKFPLNLYYAYGIRNSFGLDFDPLTGNLWDTENGPEFGDEINLVKPGFNSGWMTVQGIWKPIVSPKLEGMIAGNKILNMSGSVVNFGGKGTYSPPEFIWKETVGPTAIKFLDSDKLGKKYENDIFVSDIRYGRIYHFDLNEKRDALNLTGKLSDKIADTDEEADQSIFGSGFRAVTDLDVGPDGFLYILAESGATAKIYRIVPVGHN